MIISPPFLTGETEESHLLAVGLAAVATRDASTMAPEGNYPVSQSLMWHTGMHLQAPSDGATGYSPVRAIADGKIIFVNPPRAKVEDKTDGQAYNPFGSEASWTDNGMVVIEHETEIGADGAVPTEVKYYSSYMHLSAISDGVTAGVKIHRKSILGAPGVIYSHPGQMELSICSDKGNLKKLIGRDPLWQDPSAAPTQDGRRDAVFGDIYIYLPANTPTSSTKPTKHLRDATSVAAPPPSPPAAPPAGVPAPSTTAPASDTAAQGAATPAPDAPAQPPVPAPVAANILGTAQWVKINFGNEGATPGACVLTTYSVAGDKIAACEPESEFEYLLYQEAYKRHDSVMTVPGTQSSPSGWYELLRYGRNLGKSESVKDALPSNAAHWRKIKAVDGREVWADLNTEGSFKFSDADFLPVMNWNCFDDDTQSSDQRCDSPKLKELLVDPQDPDSKNSIEKLASRIGSETVLPKLARAICQFPNEWDKNTLNTRYQFMSERPDIAENPGSWVEAKKHLEAMGISGLPDVFTNAQWHFHPAQFVQQFRRCGWLSEKEMVQLLPKNILRQQGSIFFWEGVNTSLTDPTGIVQGHRQPLNRAMRKYGINTPLRKAAFFGNSIQETQWWGKLYEASESYWYRPWDGRGFLQLTHASNYIKYWKFLGLGAQIPAAAETSLATATANADTARKSHVAETARTANSYLADSVSGVTPQMVAWRALVGQNRSQIVDAVNAADSAGAYWAWMEMARYGDESINFERLTVSAVAGRAHTPVGTKVYYRSLAFWRASASVNLPGKINDPWSHLLNGFVDRCVPWAQSLAVLSEARFPDEANNLVLDFPEGHEPRKPT